MASQTAAKDGNSFRTQGTSSGSSQKKISMAQILIRVLAAAFTLAAIAVMLTSSQTLMLLNFAMVVRYSDTSAMRFLFGADIVACIFSVLSLICVFLLSRSKSDLRNYFFLFIHDMVIMLLLMSGCSAGLAIGYVSKYGEPKAFWAAVCNHVEKFCSRVMISIVLSFLAFFCFVALTVMSSRKLINVSTNK